MGSWVCLEKETFLPFTVGMLPFLILESLFAVLRRLPRSYSHADEKEGKAPDQQKFDVWLRDKTKT